MARLRSQQPSAPESESSDADADVCAVCEEQSQRVTVNCSGCTKLFHLGCLTPPLRRRPQLVEAWQCSDCKGEGGGKEKLVANGKRKKREAPVDVEETEQPTSKRRRVSTRSTHKQKEDDDVDEIPIAQTLPKRQNGKAAMKKKASTLPKPRADGRTVPRALSRKALVELSDDDGDEDNDADSDFVGESVSEGEDEDSISSALSSDEEERKPARRRPPMKKPPAMQRTGVNQRGGQAATAYLNVDVSTRITSTTINNVYASDADSLDIDIVGESEISDEENLYDGPHYFVEYAANGRAKCKSCEQKFLAKQLRVGVDIRHSIFGDTTYYKHLECTAIGLKAGTAANQATDETGDEDVDNKPLKNKNKKKNADPIHGLSRLQAADQKRVREYMKKNDLNGVIDERLPLTDDHFKKKGRMPEKEPSKYLTATLLPYQREALAWMVGQEESSYKGGILADEMGMGKTIQAISLMLENVREKTSGKAAKSRNSPTVHGGTLVVCPLVAVMQWKSEIERFVEPGLLSVYIHHGPKRLDSVEKIASYDIVLTTYSIIESEIRKTLGWAKVACKYCGKKYLPDKLVSHYKYFCGPDARKTALQNKQQRKNPKKKAAGESSEEEDDDDLKKPARKPKGRAKKNDDGKKATLQMAKGKSPLHQIQWTRIVLDEAHYIKDRNCNTARGVFELKSTYKWCLSGTPLQNRIGELFSLVRFLQVKKYAYYHCNTCDCQMLDYNFPDKKCAQCTHSAIQHYSYFNKKVVIPIQAYGYVGEGKLAMQRLQNDVLQHILLRRTKEGRADDISLPPKLVRIRKDRLDERENDFYEAIYTQSQAQFNTYVSSGTLLNNYAHIFDLLIRLRQAVDHPYLVIYSKTNPALQLPSSAAPLVEEQPFGTTTEGASFEDERACTICHEYMEDGVVAKCGHDFCRECVKEYIESLPAGGEATCSTCSKPLTVDLSPRVEEVNPPSNEETSASSSRSPKAVNLSSFHRNSILHRISDVHAFQSSTKIEALMQELELMRARDPSGKAIIFSQFVNMLDIIQHRLQLGGVKCVKLSGNMSMSVRDRTIKAFRDDPTVTAFLISLKAGGVALNLTVASHIFLMDPWWNPAAENQAIDRTHRLGQFKPIQATRFIIAGTVEERILKLQEKKRLIFEGTVGANVSAICRLTEEDLRFLFAT
ncbi:ATP-dependent helicase [Phytophthora cactorum]|uniref:ATP-dependent helicase n=1 Tax=Phytophthora cactorum TaxID=29920 RepID=A0A329RLI4_9STRA|nr:ATP-dependent helicase [Phytophthora cactorum]KAG2833822.1 ATP-dependent helicase [Phytophthora cactorum]KAG2836251.1 ATP-dependent helicase [Phytophthora cactorum]KAG2861925.1 ATP-dependent helicase [Phytophthora cactorum]KAG2919043.1 ATP-dependent helicase [Phytophthora cactorum]